MSAGLPNVNGTVNDLLGNPANYSGAFFSSYNTLKGGINTIGNIGWRHFDFDASRSSSVYGNSNTVQPPSLSIIYIIKY